MIGRNRSRVGARLTKGMTVEFPIPLRSVSNEEFLPLPQTPAQAQVESLVDSLGEVRVLGVDVASKRNDLPKDALSRIKMAYREGQPEPSHRVYGWVAG